MTDPITAACPLYMRAQDRRSRNGGSALQVDGRSPRLGFIVTVMSSAVFWIPFTVGALVWVGHR